MQDRKEGELDKTGPITYGGYSNIIVVNERYPIKISSNAPLEKKIALLLCAGLP